VAVTKPSVEVFIPVYNEEKDLPRCISTLHEFLKNRLDNPWRITVADNGSTDSTLSVAEAQSHKFTNVAYIHLPQKGRGRALRKAWTESQADIVSYMDVDLSTGLEAFPKMIEALESGYHIAIGSRLVMGAKVKRSLKREIVSRAYNLLVRLMFWPPFKDAQCGFKALHTDVARILVPLVKNNAWFFDTELLLVAHKNGYKIKEIPVEWAEDPDSRVKVVRTAWEDIKGLMRLRFGGLPSAPPQALQKERRPA
jgi:glycosyltransferase involved in cell wall biosynthesis